jgi:predicted esterase
MRLREIALCAALGCVSLSARAAAPADGVSPDQATFSAGKETKILDPETGGVGWYVVYVPKDYKDDHPSPTIFCYHGKNNEPKSWPFKDLTDGKGYIVVGMEYKDHETPNAAVDVENLKRIRTYVESKLKVDPKLVFMGGFSQGGWSTSSFSNLYIDKLAGLVILGAGGQPGDKAVKAVKNMPVFVGVGQNDEYNKNAVAASEAYKAKGAVVTFEEFTGLGHSVDTKDKALKDWLLKVGPENQMVKAVANAKAAEKAGKLGEAYTFYAAAGAMSGGQDAATMAQAIAAVAEKKLGDAAEEIGEHKYDEALKTLQAVDNEYAGSPFAEKAQQRIQQIKTDPAIKADVAQTQLDAKADLHEKRSLALETAKEYARAFEAYDSYQKQFPKATRFSAVKAHYDDLKANKEIAATAFSQAADRECKGLLSTADNYVKSDLPDEAKPYLRKILDKYGSTPWAAEAKARLAKIK